MATPHPFTAALVAGDLDAVGELLARDPVLRSPILARYRFRGHGEVVDVLEDVLGIVTDPVVRTEFGDGDEHLAVIGGRINGKDVEVANLLRFDETARVREIRIFARPLPGLAALMAALGPRLVRKHSTVRVALIAAMVVPVAVAAPVFERAAERLVAIRS